MRARKIKKPAPHQREALSAITNAMRSASRASVVMACGTGKTLVEMWASQAMDKTRTIVFVPTINLLQQVFHEWRDQNKGAGDFRALCVCSDSSVGTEPEGEGGSGETDEVVLGAGDIDFPTCTAPAVVNAFLNDAKKDPLARAVIFCTYHSAHIVGQAMAMRRKGDRSIGLGIFDEAHKTACAVGKPFGYALSDDNLHIDKRLFFTATPRVAVAKTVRKKQGNAPFYDMADTACYGEQIYTLSFAEAAARGLIVPYKIVISVIDDASITSDHILRYVVKSKDGFVDASVVAKQVALRRAMEKYGLKKAITFHRTIASAQIFAHTTDSAKDDGVRLIDGLHVFGEQGNAEREAVMQRFKTSDRGVISNARCLTEGVDVPSVDLVAFMDPRKSKIDIVQAAGRAMRLAGPQKTCGYILLPLHLNLHDGESAEQALLRSDFSVVADVLGALAENDEAFKDIIRAAAGGSGCGLSSVVSVDFDASMAFDRKVFDQHKFIKAIETRLMNETLSSFDWLVSKLKAFRDEKGHCRVPNQYKTASGYPLGSRCTAEKTAAKHANYSEVRRKVLSDLGLDLDVKPTRRAAETILTMIREFKAEHGHCEVPIKHLLPNGYPLGDRCVKERNRAQKEGYPTSKKHALEALGFRFVTRKRDEKCEELFKRLEAYRKQTGSCKVPIKYVCDDGFTLGTRLTREKQLARLDGYPMDRRIALEKLGVKVAAAGRKFPRAELIPNLERFVEQHGHCDVPRNYETPDGFPLWAKCEAERILAKKPGYEEEQKAKLSALGFHPDRYAVDERLEAFVSMVEQFKEEHGHAKIPTQFVTSLGVPLGSRAVKVRLRAALPGFPEKVRKRLAELGFRFDSARKSSTGRSNENAVEYGAFATSKGGFSKHKLNDAHLDRMPVRPHRGATPIRPWA
ncbi:MAG: Helicase associated domain protein [Hydrogenophaga sp.]|uniref:DEAD/DEAH box helicase n=1 Tax=Hydrogenophaga sp. TaxID=1904254 RepID=UPI002735EC42|nr:DEAD/DEAH box helicase [Hydrogenophaga sp.]MDP3351957.1 Helicase associated domain protein [Hydrogenophaga sp.]